MHRFALHALLALAAAGVAGCWPLFTPIEPAPTSAPPQARAETRSSIPPTQVSQEPERRKTASKRTTARTTHAATPDRQSSEPASNSAPEASPPSLTLAGESISRVQAEQLVDRADRSLAKIDRRKLTGNDVGTYDQASGFVSSAQRALDENDYLAASGLAQKASTLTARLAP